MKHTILIGFASLVLSATASAENITQQQTCQTMADHAIAALQASGAANNTDTIATLEQFSAAQAAMVEAGVANSATQMGVDVSAIQPSVDAQGAMLRKGLSDRYGTKVYSDYATSLARCFKAHPDKSGVTKEAMEAAVLDIIALARATS